MKIGIIGLGLMGGSFGRTLVKQGVHEVFGYDVSPAVMEKAELVKAFNGVLNEKTVKDVDMLIVATTPDVFLPAVERVIKDLKKGAVIVDFCGVKRKIMDDMERLLKVRPDLVYVGGHPMAGREFSGIEHAITTLFDKASMILVNLNADVFALDKIKKFFLSVGFSEVVITSADNHDAMIAYTSQLCHVVSNAFIKNKTAENHFGYSAGSYKDLTRVARLNPDMWTELMFDNGDKLLSELDEYILNLTAYRDALRDGDRDKFKELLSEGNLRKLAIDTKSGKN